MPTARRGKKATPAWTRHSIAVALVLFYTQHRRWPVTYDLDPRQRPPYLPHLNTICRICGGLAEARTTAQHLLQKLMIDSA